MPEDNNITKCIYHSVDREGVKKPAASTLSKSFFLSSMTFVDFSPNGKKARPEAEAAAVVKETGEEVVANAVPVVEEVDKETADEEAARVKEGTVEE
jgi:hypothetical protein